MVGLSHRHAYSILVEGATAPPYVSWTHEVLVNANVVLGADRTGAFLKPDELCCDQPQNPQAVLQWAQLRVAAGGALAVADGDFLDGHAFAYRTQGQLGLDFEAAASQLNHLAESAIHRSVAAQHVMKRRSRQKIHDSDEEPVAEASYASERIGRSMRETVAHDHVSIARVDGRKQCVEVFSEIGIVAVHENTDVRIHGLEHTLDNEAFAASLFVDDLSPRLSG